MPVYKCSNGKWRIGTGPCIFKTLESAERAYAAYRAIKHSECDMAQLKHLVERLNAFLESREKKDAIPK